MFPFIQAARHLTWCVVACFVFLNVWSRSALAQESGPSSTENPPWNPGSHLSITGGVLVLPSDQQDTWNQKKPLHLQIQQAFRIAQMQGELELGAGFTYTAAGGRIEKPQSNKKNAKEKEQVEIGFFSLGLTGNLNYRFAYTPNPVIAPRVGAFVGLVQESQKKLQDNYETKAEDVFKPIAGVKLHGEISLLSLNDAERGAVTFGYGLQDFVLILGTTYLMDLQPKESYKMGGYTWEAGLGMLFP